MNVRRHLGSSRLTSHGSSRLFAASFGVLQLLAATILSGSLLTACGDDGGSTPTVSPVETTPSIEPSPTIVGPTPCITDTDNDTVCYDEDCNDTDLSVYPGAKDDCGDLVDKNCDNQDGCGVDDDGDFYTDDQGDCDDFNSAINPGASDTCDNQVDENCDGVPDNGCSGVDDDGDGYCDNNLLCTDGSTAGDCNDADGSISPAAEEVFDGKDNNCDGDTEGRITSLISGVNVTIEGEASDQRVGFSVAGIRPRMGNINDTSDDILTADGDYLADVIVGMPGYAGNENGGAAILPGKYLGAPATYPVSISTIIIGGEQNGSQTGFSVSSNYSINYDQFMDFSIGAPTYYATRVDAENAGSAYGFFGGGTDLVTTSVTSAQFNVKGYLDDVMLGYVTAGGDVDGDGVDDFLMGCPNADAGSWAFILPGSAGVSGQIQSSALGKLDIDDGVSFGQSIAFAGDTNQDGAGDMIIGSRFDHTQKQGAVAWIPGSELLTTVATYADIASLQGIYLVGEEPSENVGWSVSGNGDLNGDGVADFAVADEFTVNWDDPAVYLMFGGSQFLLGSDLSSLEDRSIKAYANVLLLLDDSDSCPCSVAADGDLNGDGFDDLLVGVSASRPNGVLTAGRVYVLLGRSDFPTVLNLINDADFVLEGVNEDENVGFSIAWIGDMTGDGYDDFVVGAPGADVSEIVVNSGRAYILFGSASN